jgi:hypothetical protein
MNRRFIVSLAMGAGLTGGLLSRCLTPGLAFAQTDAPRQVQAHSFVLVDEQNSVAGTFKPLLTGRNETIVLLDRNGREVWRAGASWKLLNSK